MRKIDKIIIHCSATPEGRHFTIADIDRWHKERGFSGIGYHYVIYLDGSVHKGRDIRLAGAHTVGQNATSIGICYVGGLDKAGNSKDTRTHSQQKALRRLVEELAGTYPGVSVHGHNEFAAKDCPCFRVKDEYKEYL